MTCNHYMTLPPKIFKSISLVFCINTLIYVLFIKLRYIAKQYIK